jgi:molybdopterin molybdotransferase
MSSLTRLDQAQSLLEQELHPRGVSETLDLSNADGRILAKDIHSVIDVPGFDSSAMDGFALCAQGLASQQMMSISQTIQAGHVGQALQAGTAARIFTGAPIPPGADAVVIQEDTEYTESELKVLQAPQAGENIRKRGHDIQVGTMVLKQGHRLRPQDIGLLASLGISQLEVYKPLRVVIINTGNELISPGEQLQAGQIYDSNSFTLQSLLKRLGMQVIRAGIVKDDLQSTCAALEQAATEADCIISSGGVSVGEADHVKAALEKLGTLSLWKLAIKPGKPFSFGSIGNTPFFGLPGNPVAVFVTFLLLVKPGLLRMQGASRLRAQSLQIAADFDRNNSGIRDEFLRVRLEKNNKGQICLMDFDNQGSSVLNSLSWADGLALLPAKSNVQRGELLTYMPFSGLM